MLELPPYYPLFLQPMNNNQRPFTMSKTPTGTLHLRNSTDVFLPSHGEVEPADYDFHTLLPNRGAMQPPSTTSSDSVAAMREIVFRMAAMQPVRIDPESVKPPKRRNVRISKDPQSVAARHRRERISERIRILQRMVPGGTKMDTASMLDEAVHYVKFLKDQVRMLEGAAGNNIGNDCYDNVSLSSAVGVPVTMMGEGNYAEYYQTGGQSTSSSGYREFED